MAPSLSTVSSPPTIVVEPDLDRVDLREKTFATHPPLLLLFSDLAVAIVDERDILAAVLLEPVSGSGFEGSISRTSAHSDGS
jgi:hypothetical protein